MLYYILRLNIQSQMGAEQPKKIAKVNKAQIDIACLKAKIHLQLMRDRKNNQIIKGEKQLVAKLKSKNRNKVEEILVAQRVVNGLKYAQACNLLMGYAANLRPQAHFLSQNMFNPGKLDPWLPMIYSLIFGADQLGLSSLNQFKALMRALNDPVGVQKYVNPELITLLSPSPTPQEVNTYMLQMSQRNQISLEQINMIGHKFTKQWHSIPSIPPSQNQNFSDFQKKLAQDFKEKFTNPYGNNHQYINQNTSNNNNPYNQEFNSNAQQIKPNQVINPNNWSNPQNQNIGQLNHNNYIGNSNPYEISSPQKNIGGPMIYQPGTMPLKKQTEQVRMSITSINDIDYYPQIDPKAPIYSPQNFKDPSFDEICDRLRKGL